MSAEFPSIGRALVLVGAALILMGGVLLVLPKLPGGGRLPGDLLIQREHATFYVPLTTCLLLSVLVTVIVWMVSRFR